VTAMDEVAVSEGGARAVIEKEEKKRGTKGEAMVMVSPFIPT
jgi:hypothetical protein